MMKFCIVMIVIALFLYGTLLVFKPLSESKPK